MDQQFQIDVLRVELALTKAVVGTLIGWLAESGKIRIAQGEELLEQLTRRHPGAP